MGRGGGEEGEEGEGWTLCHEGAFIHLDCQLLWTIYIVIMGKERTMKRNSVVVKISHLPQ